MPYLIGYAPRHSKTVSEARASNARAAMELIYKLKMSEEEIRYVKEPRGSEIFEGELPRFADEEDEQRPRSAQSDR